MRIIFHSVKKVIDNTHLNSVHAHYLNEYTIIAIGTGKNYKCVHMLSYSCKILNRITSCEITSRELKSLLGLDDVYGSAIFGQLPAAARRVEQFLIKLKTC